MKLQLVSYDLNTPGQNYPAIVNRLQSIGATRILYSQWLVRTAMTAEQLRDDLVRYLDANDGILVADVTNSPMAWRSLRAEIKTTFNLT